MWKAGWAEQNKLVYLQECTGPAIEGGACENHAAALERHVCLETEQPGYTCAKCNKVYKFKQNLVRHLAKCHQSAPTETFLCHHCGKVFNQNHHLQRHLARCQVDGGIHKCPHCMSSFATEYELNRHVTRCSSHVPTCQQRSFTCRQCGACFQISNSNAMYKK
jgi:uncharacterized C2H2 Zn-finger protein